MNNISILSTSAEINEYAAAMAKVQGEINNPDKNREVTVNGRTKEGKAYSYNFKYATYDKILESARPILAKNEICIIQVPTGTENVIFPKGWLLKWGGDQVVEAESSVGISVIGGSFPVRHVGRGKIQRR